MKELIEKLLEEVDPDIREIMLRVSNEGYEYWTTLKDAPNTILQWQSLRDRRNAD